MELDRVVPEDFPLAAKFFTLAANQNITPAGYKLGVMHLMGGGIPKNLAEAQRWFKFAAERGHADAQIDLRIMYLRKNRTTAHMWVNIGASLGGKDGANTLKVVEGFMTPADISAAQDLARECVRKKYNGC